MTHFSSFLPQQRRSPAAMFYVQHHLRPRYCHLRMPSFNSVAKNTTHSLEPQTTFSSICSLSLSLSLSLSMFARDEFVSWRNTHTSCTLGTLCSRRRIRSSTANQSTSVKVMERVTNDRKISGLGRQKLCCVRVSRNSKTRSEPKGTIST
jgi:hypothetical protein